MLEQRGHTVLSLGANPQTFHRVRRTLRLMTMVHEEPRSLTYRHKATLLRGTRRWQAAVWRAIRRRGWNLEDLAVRIEARLPIPAHVLQHVSVAKPDVLVWPTLMHMDAVENDTVKAARRLRIPIIGMPASWDTLTTKGQWLVRPDSLMLWGTASRNHAICAHGFADDRLATPGPAHFHPYESGVTEQGPLVLIAGTSLHYWRDENTFVAKLRAAIDVPVIHRPHPKRRGAWDMDVGSVKRDLDNSFVVVAAFSTVVIEAALCGRPSILVGFGASEHGGRVLDVMQYTHMSDIARWPGVHLARSFADLCAIIRSMANGDAPDSPHTLRAAALTVANAEPGIRERIVDAIETAR